MSEGNLYSLLLSSSVPSTACLTCSCDKIVGRYRRRLTKSRFCNERCAKKAQEVCQLLEHALKPPFPLDVAVSELVNAPGFTLNIIQTLTDNRPEKMLRQILLKLAKNSDTLPPTLFLNGVTCASTLECAYSGGFADIFIGKYNDHPVAVKRLRVNQTVEVSVRDKVKQDFYREALVWRNLSHRYILPFLGVDSALFRQSLCTVSPWMAAGNIRDVISQKKSEGSSGKIQLRQILEWYTEITLGLEYLHLEGVVHGDLRGSNIFIDDDNHTRISDFGVVTFAERVSREYCSSARCGNERWLAPEVIYPEVFGFTSTRPTYASDIYSLGCLFIEIFTGSDPFQGIPTTKLLINVPKGLRPSRPEAIEGMEMPDSVWELLCLCWNQQPSERPSVGDVVKYADTHFIRVQERWESNETSSHPDMISDQCEGLLGVYEGANQQLEGFLHNGFRATPRTVIQQFDTIPSLHSHDSELLANGTTCPSRSADGPGWHVSKISAHKILFCRGGGNSGKSVRENGVSSFFRKRRAAEEELISWEIVDEDDKCSEWLRTPCPTSGGVGDEEDTLWLTPPMTSKIFQGTGMLLPQSPRSLQGPPTQHPSPRRLPPPPPHCFLPCTAQATSSHFSTRDPITSTPARGLPARIPPRRSKQLPLAVWANPSSESDEE